MVKTGGPTDSEFKWYKLTKEQVKTLVSEVSLEISQLIDEIESKLKLLKGKSSTDQWYALVAYIGRKLKAVINCFPPYSAANYEPLKDMQYRTILDELKDYNKKKVYLDQYFDLKAEILALEQQLSDMKEARRQKEEYKMLSAQHRQQIAANRSYLTELKAEMKKVKKEIVNDRKAAEHEIAELRTKKAKAVGTLNDLRATVRQKTALLKDYTEQKDKEEAAMKREYQENAELVRALASAIRGQKVVQAEINCQTNNGICQ